jgi:phosphatidylethanolamine/phosphatidyl-N-methylethanolamine N-methyltransferase
LSLKKFDLNKWYESDYALINASANPNSLAFKYLHKSLEKNFKSNAGFEILEIGANIGEHVGFVSKNFESYTLSDIRETKFLNQGNPKIKFQIADVESLPFEDCTFDRIISTCVFHHLNDPTRGLEEIRRVVRIGGYISILLPNDPGIMYRALRRLTTLRTAKRQGLLDEVQLVHALEHKNHYLSIRTLIKWVFENDEIKFSFKPFWIPSYNINAITVIRIRRLG